jgi:pilus assembly protein CpaB
MNRQRKLLIFGLAWVSAGLLTWLLYANTVAPQREKQVRLVVAVRDMPLGALLKQSDLRLVNYPEKDVPKGAIFAAGNAVNRVLLVPVNANEPLLLAKLSQSTAVEGIPSTIDPGYRAVSVPITDASGVAGLIQPNSRVDVIFTRPGTMAEATSSTILQNVKILSTGRAVPTGQTVDARAPRSPVVTLVLSPADAQKLELAKNQGKISLSLRNPLDTTTSGETGPVTAEVLDPNIDARMAARKGRIGRKGQVEDPSAWNDLTGQKKAAAPERKEQEKPRVVVDVYRGDRHVQELFK